MLAPVLCAVRVPPVLAAAHAAPRGVRLSPPLRLPGSLGESLSTTLPWQRDPFGDMSWSVTLTGVWGCERLCVKASGTGLLVKISLLRACRGMKYGAANLKEAMMHSCFIAWYR